MAVLVLLASWCGALAQSKLESTAVGSGSAPQLAPEPLLLTNADAESRGEQAGVGSKWELSGPIVPPLKAKKFWEVPRRVLHLVNPFAPHETTPQVPGTRELSPRAWSTVVGWSPGRSAFPDETTHEPSMCLFSLTRTPAGK